MNNGFRNDEIVVMTRLVKGQKKTHIYPKVGGRLRIIHEIHDKLNIQTEIIQYDGTVAVVKATTTTPKGSFNGCGMAGVERDKRLADAILELAETRAIARSLRFSGVGVEYTGLEEVSHITGNDEENISVESTETNEEEPAPNTPADNRASNAQLKAVMALARRHSMGNKALEEECRSRFGVTLEGLTRDQAAEMIQALQSNK